MGNSLCLFPLISSQGFVIHKGVLGYWDSACKWYSADVPSVGNLGSALGLRTPRFPAWPPLRPRVVPSEKCRNVYL